MHLPITILLSLAAQDAPVEIARNHYATVEAELLRAEPAGLSSAQRAGRAQLIDALRAYRERGDFGRADLQPGERRPVFVDDGGRRCAIAELLHVTGENALVERVRADANHAWILDLRTDAEFDRWLTRHGLGFDEAARIQVPTIAVTPRDDGGRGIPSRDGWGGPGDTATPAGGATGGAAPVPAAPGGSSTGRAPTPAGAGPAPTTGGSAPAPSGAPTTMSLTITNDDGWWLWWEYAKLEYLVPNRLTLANTPVTGEDAAGALREAIERARRSSLPRFLEGVAHADSSVRSAAATALGQTGSADAIEPLLALLGDSSQEVRHRAILALGATGSPRAAAALFLIARTGTHLAESKSAISPYARSYAVVALALARRAGFSEPMDVAVASIARERTKSERDSLPEAAMLHHMIAPGEALERLALDLAQDEDQSPGVRCRAVEALSSTQDPAVLSKLQHMLSNARIDLRRSAAQALGTSGNALVLPALQTAHELEAEPMTRGLILIAIGRVGGAKAHAFLTKVLADGERGQRRWAALGLGVLAYRTQDVETSRAVRDALAQEKNRDAHAAYWIASGLLRDDQSVPQLVKSLSDAADARQRMYAATALALIGDPRSAEALRARLPLESSPLARVGIAQALGIVGDPRDAVEMRASMDRLAEPALQGLAATALAFHGTPEALGVLSDLSASREGSKVRLASSIEGMGMLLARSRQLALGDASRKMNYTVMADWTQSLFQTTF